MCVVSAVMDYGREQWPGVLWPPVVSPPVPVDRERQIAEMLERHAKEREKKAADEVGRLPTKAEIEEFLKLVEAAKRFDEIAKQPHCEDPEKIKFLDAMVERLERLEQTTAAIAEKVGVERKIISRPVKPHATGIAPPAPEPEPEPDLMECLVGSDELLASYTFGERTFCAGDVVRRAFERSGMTIDEWNRQAQVDINSFCAHALQTMIFEAGQASPPAGKREA